MELEKINSELENDAVNPDVQFSSDAKMSVVLLGKYRDDKYGKIASAVFRVVASDAKDGVNAAWKLKLADIRKAYSADTRNGPRCLGELAEAEKNRNIEIIRRTNEAVYDAASRLPDIIATMSSAIDNLMERPDHTMSHGTKAGDFVADLCGVVLDTKRAVQTAVKAATATYTAEIG